MRKWNFGFDPFEAGKAYEASLRYVIAMIFNELYPEESIRFSYNVSRSIFCQPLGNFHIERRIVDQVANRLRNRGCRHSD